MIWNKPRNVWWWLALLTPAVLAIIAAQMAKWWMPPIPPLRYGNEIVIPNTAAYLRRVIAIAFDVIIPSSAIIALILSHGVALGQRIVNAIFFLLCLVFVNGFVAFAGCALTGAPNPSPQELTPANFRSGGGNDAASGQTLPASQLPAAR